MKSEIRELFSFTASERNGTAVLLVLIMMLSVFISLQGKFVTLPQEDFTSFDAFLATVEENDSADFNHSNSKFTNHNSEPRAPNPSEEAGQKSVYHTKELFNFNPNGLAVDDWVRLGLSPAQARSVKKFETKGGKFTTKEDVRKLFVISEERYQELEPFIVLPERENFKLANNPKPGTQNPPIPSIVELNTADSFLLVSVKGIGPSFAKRILDYRERLGGFYAVIQLKEVFGIDEEKYGVIKDFVKADSSYIRKININAAQAPDFKKLPYISWPVANGLVNYRKSHGNFKSVAGIKSCALITEELYNKIVPYLSI
ncbi:MAG: helix-hairpin-helix domain-containing protein [Bacteroidia bacterium]